MGHPAFKITVNGDNLLGNDRVKSIKITDEIGEVASALEVVFNDFDNKIALPKSGVTITVSIGYDGNLCEYGSFIADDVSLSSGLVTIHGTAFDKGKSLKSVADETYGLKLDEALSRVAERNALKLTIQDEIKGFHFEKTINQHNESDLHFLTRILRESGGFFKIDGKNLMVFKRGVAKTAVGNPMPSVAVTPKNVLSDWRISRNMRDDFKSCKAKYLSDSGTIEHMTAGDGKPEKVLLKLYSGAEEAKKMAENGLKAGFTTEFCFKTPGNPQFRANSVATATGFKAGVDGPYIVSRVVHTLYEGGYETDVTAAAAAGG